MHKLGPGDRKQGEINKTQTCETGVNQIFQPLRKSGVVWPNYTLCRELACRPPPPLEVSPVRGMGRELDLAPSLFPTHKYFKLSDARHGETTPPR